jgi:tetratricopeptide (TPR) repeat protein
VKSWPLDLTRRVYLMTAYYRTRQPQALAKLLQATDALFHKEDRWNESSMSQLGRACLECELFEQAVEYLKEAIAAHATARLGKPCKFAEVDLTRHLGDAELASQYRDLALSYKGLKNTKAGVDAAASAIVVWPRRHHQRAEMINTLRRVLSDSPDLPAYVKTLDQETKDSGQDKPIVRKLLGEVFQERKQYAAAVAQFRIAVQLSPGDSEIHTKLIACYDALEDNAGAIAQSFDWLELNRRNFDLWKHLGDRLDKTSEAAEAERARTSLAEVAPGETEGHVKLAETREEQQRLEEALEQWQTVAELRKLEPIGLLNIARVQLALNQKAAATETLKQLDDRTWPEHFQEELKKQLPELRKKAGQ